MPHHVLNCSDLPVDPHNMMLMDATITLIPPTTTMVETVICQQHGCVAPKITKLESKPPRTQFIIASTIYGPEAIANLSDPKTRLRTTCTKGCSQQTPHLILPPPLT